MNSMRWFLCVGEYILFVYFNCFNWIYHDNKASGVDKIVRQNNANKDIIQPTEWYCTSEEHSNYDICSQTEQYLNYKYLLHGLLQQYWGISACWAVPAHAAWEHLNVYKNTLRKFMDFQATFKC